MVEFVTSTNVSAQTPRLLECLVRRSIIVAYLDVRMVGDVSQLEYAVAMLRSTVLRAI